MKKIIIFVFIAVILIAGVYLFVYDKKTENDNVLPINIVSYLCDGDKKIEASFYKGEVQKSEPGEMPIPTGSVYLILSDGRKFNLPQTISASGIRYANENESFVFWGKGNSALILENNQEKSYIGCIALSKDADGLEESYADGKNGFSVRYPKGFVVNKEYKYQEFGPGKDIWGVKFIIPESLAKGTNLSNFDTGVSVEEIPNVNECVADLFVYNQTNQTSITDGDVVYSVAETNGAGAGNFYEEKVWAIPGTNPCIGVRYFIHSTNIGNYDPGTVVEFDRQSLIDQFDKIRHSLVIEQ